MQGIISWSILHLWHYELRNLGRAFLSLGKKMVGNRDLAKVLGCKETC